MVDQRDKENIYSLKMDKFKQNKPKLEKTLKSLKQFLITKQFVTFIFAIRAKQ